MNTSELKNKIQGYLDKADEQVLSLVSDVFENYYSKQTVAFHPDGTPMSKEEYKAALDLAEAQIKDGDYIPVEQM